jgi:class 3 adenylate cyclase
LDETDRRMDLAIKANSVGDLALLVWDLPDKPTAEAPVPQGRRARRAAARQADSTSIWMSAAFRAHATAYTLVNSMLVGIWAITDSHDIFWPFFPIAGWGIGLGMHAVATHTVERSRQEKAARRAAQGDRPRPPKPIGTSRPAINQVSAQKTTVSVMFTDVVDSTRLTKVIGDEDWIRLRARYRDLLRSCYQANRGQEVSSQGDGFLARFPTPAEAVRCAAQIQTRLESQRQDVGFAPSIRIGINCGEAMDEAGDLLGTVVNVAARVTAEAEANEILVTEAVADRLDGSFKLSDGGLRPLKGLDRTAHVLSVIWR